MTRNGPLTHRCLDCGTESDTHAPGCPALDRPEAVIARLRERLARADWLLQGIRFRSACDAEQIAEYLAEGGEHGQGR